MTDRIGRIRSYQYDAADQLIGEKWSTTANSAVSHAVAYGHDANGNLTSATDALSSGNPNFDVTIAYDALNRPSHTTQPFGVSLDFQYDAADNRTQVIDNKGGQSDYAYDDLNRLTTLTLSGIGVTGTSTAWAYDKTTADLTSVTKSVGGTASGTTAFGYDALGRNDSVTQSNGSGVTVGSYTYTRDLADRLTGSTFVTGGVTSSVTSSHSFSYYDDNQLKVADGVLSKYDDGGNLKGTYNAATGAQLSSLSYGTANRLQNDGVYTYTYDDAGQMTGKSKSGESWTYGYDFNGQMVSAGNGTDAVAYTFDAFGNRLSRVQSGGTSKMERFAYDGADAFLDLNGSNTVTVRRQYGPGVDNLLSRQAAGTVEWYGTDGQGSVRQVFDNKGNQTSWGDYEAHGALVGGGSLTDRYGFTGREEDGLTGQRYNRARVLDGQSWTSEDPMGFAAGDSNLRRYVGNNPATKTDASGLEAENQSHSIVVDNSSSSPPASQPGWWRRQARRAGGLLDELKSVANYVASNPLTAFTEFNKGLASGALAVANGAGKAVVELVQIGRDLGNTAIAGGVLALQAVGLTNRNYLYDTHSGLFGGYDRAVRRNDGTSGDVWVSAVGNAATAGTLGLGQAFATAVDTGDWESFAEAAGGNAVGVFGPLGAARAFRGVRGGAPGSTARGPSRPQPTQPRSSWQGVEYERGGFEPVELSDIILDEGAGRGPGRIGNRNIPQGAEPLSPSNYPRPDPPMSAPPVRYEPISIEEVIRMRTGKGPTTKSTHGTKNIEAHHRRQVPIKKGGVMDELEMETHRGKGNHKRHSLPSQLTPEERAQEIRDHWKCRGGEYILPGEGI